MIDPVTVQRMINLVKSRQVFEHKDIGRVVASLKLNDFCKLVHEDCNPEYAEDMLERVQNEINNLNATEDQLIIGYSSYKEQVHWHVLPKEDVRYKNLGIHYTC